jgi:hypothetical protein
MSSVVISGDTSGQVTLAAPAVAGTTTITMPAVTGTMTVLSATQSMVRLNTANGYGSTNTKIRRFTTTVTNQGTDITYADSATLGALFTINTNGVYAISFTDQYTGGDFLGISLNTTTPTTNVSAIAASEVLVTEQTVGGISGYSSTVSWIGYLLSGSLIRPHTNGSATGATTNSNQFTIVRVT